MERIYGESSEILYSESGGIALYAAGDDETIIGGSGNQGTQETWSRIYWVITRVDNGDGIYTYPIGPDMGGITGVSWFFDDPNSPFYPDEYNTPGEIWNIATNNGNSLDVIFAAWNSDTSQTGVIKRSDFMSKLAREAYGCTAISGG